MTKVARKKKSSTAAADEALLARFEAKLETLDPDDLEVDDALDLRAIRAAEDALQVARAALNLAVAKAHANGRNWGEVGLVLGVSRQAARQRFATAIDATNSHSGVRRSRLRS